MDKHRERLLKAAAEIRAEEARSMSDDQLMDVIRQRYGMPAGTQLTDEQLKRIMASEATAKISNTRLNSFEIA